MEKNPYQIGFLLILCGTFHSLLRQRSSKWLCWGTINYDKPNSSSWKHRISNCYNMHETWTQEFCHQKIWPCHRLKLWDFNDLQLSFNETYIFEICMTTAFKWGIGQVPELASCWDSHSQLLERVIKMSPDGADFLHKRFYGWQQYPYQKSLSQLFSIWS